MLVGGPVLPARLFSDDRCQLITGESLTRKTQLSSGNDDFGSGGRGIASRSNNNEALDGVALFSARLTLETYVTGAPNPVKCSASYGRGLLDGKRNPPKRRQVFDRRRSGLDHARVEDDRVSTGPLRRAGSDPRWTLLPRAGSSGQPVSESRLRRHRLNRPPGPRRPTRAPAGVRLA